ncbi:MAG: type I-C CRISPR-associated protein Cas8c/Csd1 [Lachnospiraceae bacterium]|nr:type I-C CRISPR-associated protein Cas8c/Csd1 [Lachnospiraceae bacterium]
MLIQGLCDYYDILAKAGKVLPSGYSSVKIHYIVSLTEDGEIEELINYQKKEEIKVKEKVKVRWVPRDCMMPQRTEKPGIEANVMEHRPLYVFGLNMDNGELSPKDRTGKAQKSHEAFVETNLQFIEGMDSPVINAFRNFLMNWKPEQETGNTALLDLGKDYGKSGFVFCLSGAPDILLHEDPQIRRKWEQQVETSSDSIQEGLTAQCAVSGETTQIARIHNKIKGVYGGLATGTVLVSFKNASENSYGKEQSYNSNISEIAMKKYTEALNYLVGSEKHRVLLDDMTIVFWAMEPSEDNEALFMEMLWGGQSEKMDADATENMIRNLLKDGKQGMIAEGRLQSLDQIKPEVDFYMVGFKPNSSRLAMKFIYRKKYADVLWNLAKFQQDLQVSEKFKTVPFWRIKSELISPKAKNATANPGLLVKIMEAAIYGRNYPEALLETVVRRVKTDVDISMNAVRAGLIRACLNRNYLKGELKVTLDRENFRQAYLYGRLFAVLEKLQQDAAGNHLNRTIKDTFFSSASTRPAMVFPRLLRLAQNHLNKSKNAVYFNKQIGEIMGHLDGEFKDILSLKEQGQFMIGYYQQYQSFFEKNEKIQKEDN